MKHKKFNDVYPYTYYFKNKISGEKYHGVRYANINKNLSPNEDFAIIYFSSGKLKEDFKKNKHNFEYRLVWTFDTIKEALDYESKVNTKLMHKSDWAVWNNSKAIINQINPRLGAIVKGTETALKIGKSNLGKKRSIDIIRTLSKIQITKVENKSHYWQTDLHADQVSKRMIENNPSKNGLSSQHRKKISVALRGKKIGPQTEEHKKKLSEANKGKISPNKGKKIGPQTEEHKKKSADARRGKKRGKYKLTKPSNGTKHLLGKRACCLCCHREFDLGNLAKHLKKKELEK